MTAISDAGVDPFAASPWLQGTFVPVTDERDDVDLPVSGSLPQGLRGAFLRDGPNALFPPIARYHLFDGDGMLHGPTQVCGEAVFAPDPSATAEDGGRLLDFAHDRAADRSDVVEHDVVVRDAGTLDEVARVHLPRRVPFECHGSFLP